MLEGGLIKEVQGERLLLLVLVGILVTSLSP
jgi:hypothetical protein